MDMNSKLAGELEFLIQAIEAQIEKVKLGKEKKMQDFRK